MAVLGGDTAKQPRWSLGKGKVGQPRPHSVLDRRGGEQPELLFLFLRDGHELQSEGTQGPVLL